MTQSQSSTDLSVSSGAEEGTITQTELESYSDIDNMSISDIIQQRFKNKEKITQITTPQEVAEIIIKAPEDANQKDNTEGSATAQTEYNSKLQDIETNKMEYWGDIHAVKNNLWKKLHSVKDTMQQGAVNLAQLISDSTNVLMNGPTDNTFVQLSESETQSSVSESNIDTQGTKMRKSKTKNQNIYLGISSVKRLNTQRTMILYFCIMSVLMCCCLGRCLVVPISQ